MTRLQEFKDSLSRAIDALKYAEEYLGDAHNDFCYSPLSIKCEIDKIAEAHKIAQELMVIIRDVRDKAHY